MSIIMGIGKRQKIKNISRACIEANPDIAELKEIENVRKTGNTHFVQHRTIRLADVLLAIMNENAVANKFKLFEQRVIDVVRRWAWDDNNLENQSEETLDLIRLYI